MTDPKLISDWLFAAERGDLSTLKRLLSAEPGLVDALGQGPYWEGSFRAVHYAISRGHRRIVRWLLARGASAGPVAGESDWAPLHFAATPLRPDLVRLLIDHGAQMDIFVAAALGNVRVVRKMLRNDPNLVTGRGPDGATPLHFAGSPGVAKALLAAGADPQTRDAFHHQTPVEWTIEKRKVVAVLAKAGAEIDLHLACALGDLRRVKAFARDSPYAINAKFAGKEKTFCAEGETPLGIAARYGQRQVVDFLLAQGASATGDSSPLPGAVARGDRTIVKQLLEAGADPNAFGPHGYASLHGAAIRGNLSMIRMLLSTGAKLDLKDKEHHSTPVGWAAYHRHPRVVAFLKARGGV
jgi:ankyrin repeat protein